MKKLFIFLNCVIVAAAAVVLGPAFALADVPGAYTSFGYATGVHGIAGTDAFPNFQNGAVNNRYPMAEVAQDASPSSSATATYFDSGPAAATVGSQYNQGCSSSGGQPPPSQMCQNPNNSVPYAKATYPGGPATSHIDTCNGCGSGPNADATAAELNALASGYYAGGGTQPFSGAYGRTSTTMDQGGTLTVVTHSEVDSFTVGTVKISKVMVDVNATSTVNGANGTASVSGGEVTANGQPVAVTDQGVTIVDKQPVPCSSVPRLPGAPQPAPVPAAPPPPTNPIGGLPLVGTSGSGSTSSGSSSGSSTPSGGSAGTSSGCVPTIDVTYIKLWTVAPTKTVDGSHIKIWATGLHVFITHPSPGPGVPTQTAEYILGEGYADLQAGAGGLGGAFNFGNLGGFGAGGFGGGDFGGFGDQGAGSGGPGAAAAAIGAALSANRVPLAFLFLTLETLLLASAAAWVWARNTPSDRVPDEVLSP